MAKTPDTKTAADEFEFGEYSGPAQAENPYADKVAALIKHNESRGDENGTITIRVEPGTGPRQKILFQQAANAQDKTARLVGGIQETDEHDVLTFRLKPKEAARPGRGGRGKVAAEATE